MTEDNPPNMVRALIVQPDGSFYYENIPTGYPEFAQSFLTATQEFPNTYLEALYPRGDMTTWFDEEGKYKNLPRNALAYNIYLALGGAPLFYVNDYLAGTVAFTGREGPEVADCPEIDELVRDLVRG